MQGRAVPKLEGIIVCIEQSELLREVCVFLKNQYWNVFWILKICYFVAQAWEQNEARIAEQRRLKREKAVCLRWKKLVCGVERKGKETAKERGEVESVCEWRGSNTRAY